MTIPVLLAALTAIGAARAGASESTPRFVSLQTSQVINEVRDADRFHFEKCDFVHLDGSDVAEELAARAFANCAPLGEARPLSARAEIERRLNRALAERRADLADPSVVRWTIDGLLQGALFGGIARVGARYVFVRSAYPVKLAALDFARWGGIFGTATGWVQAYRAIEARGENQAMLGVLDAEMPVGTYILDQRTDDRLVQMRVFDSIAAVVARVTADFKP